MQEVISNAYDIYLFLVIFPPPHKPPFQASSSPIPRIRIWSFNGGCPQPKKKKKEEIIFPPLYFMQVQKPETNTQKLIRLDNKINIKFTLVLPSVALCTYP